MQFILCQTRPASLVTSLVAVWEQSVRATHTFLDEAAITQIKAYVPQALDAVPTLVVAYNKQQLPVGFMGVAADRLEMLFLAPETRGQGVGRALVTMAMTQYGVTRVTVNEQNPQAVGFYQHMGFVVAKRLAHDEQGQPYPILKMVRA